MGKLLVRIMTAGGIFCVMMIIMTVCLPYSAARRSWELAE